MSKIDPGKVQQIIQLARLSSAEAGDFASLPRHTGLDAETLLAEADPTEVDPSRDVLVGLVDELNIDEQSALVAIAWIGRGSYDVMEWDEALKEVRRVVRQNGHTGAYLTGMPLLADYLEEGMAATMLLED